MKKYHLFAAVLLLAMIPAGAQRYGVREEVLSDWNKCSGLDCLYDLSPKASTPAPKGYEATYISHYGRHGSRYAYDGGTYSVLLGMLRDAAAQDNLTEYGSWLLEQMEPFWEKVRYRVGELTPLGWRQHQGIARTMVGSFPAAFGKGSVVDACSSPSVRSILSMSSACAALSRLAPKSDIYEHQGLLDYPATVPTYGGNPYPYKGPELEFPYSESVEEFFLRRCPDYGTVLGRMFKDTSSVLGERQPDEFFYYLYMLVAGMNSLSEDEAFDVSGIFTPGEYALQWEIDNYRRFREYWHYRTGNSSIVDNIVAKADGRLASGVRGADLRYGHDHVMMALLMIMDIDGFDTEPESADDLVLWFQTFRSPMATNLQFVFYTPKRRGGEPLVKVLLNGEEVRLGNCPAETGPYYRWSVLKRYLRERTDKFVTR